MPLTHGPHPEVLYPAVHRLSTGASNFTARVAAALFVQVLLALALPALAIARAQTHAHIVGIGKHGEGVVLQACRPVRPVAAQRAGY